MTAGCVGVVVVVGFLVIDVVDAVAEVVQTVDNDVAKEVDVDAVGVLPVTALCCGVLVVVTLVPVEF